MTLRVQDSWKGILLSAASRLGLMCLVIFVLLIVSTFPLPGAHFSEVRPAFVLMAVFYWTILWPGVFTYFLTFCLGIALDLLAGFPPGLNALPLVLVQWITFRQRKFLLGQPFRVVWAGLALVAVCTGALQWLMYSIFTGHAIAVRPQVVSVVLTCALFPVAAPALSAFGRWVAARSSLSGK
ncbi:MAG TPA: rod shape-determining protein MreD [Alphaproteobacteria bacterium]|nr:rod shape-determining protein MreD [Alphaproteobacteria bacterium]